MTGTPAATAPGREDIPWYALGLEGADVDAEVADLRKRIHHLGAALAGENEGVRLWMLDCGNLVDQFRRERDSLTGRVAELVGENGELRKEIARLGERLEETAADKFDARNEREDLRQLVAGILDALDHGGPYYAGEWRERAGLSVSPDGGGGRDAA